MNSMRHVLEKLFGIQAAPWAQGGSWRVEWSAMPRHDAALLLIVSILAAAGGVLYLYRREGRNLSLPIRVVFTTLRMIVLLGVLAMLLEPVMVFSRQEWIRSNLLVLVDDSQSMDLKDAYVDEPSAKTTAASLKLAGSAQELRDTPRRQLIHHLLDGGLTTALTANGDRVVHTVPFAAQMADSAAQSPDLIATTNPSTQPASTLDRTGTALGVAIRQAITSYRGQPIAGVLVLSDGQSNTGEPPAKAAEWASGEGVPVSAVAVGTLEGPRNAKLTKVDVSQVVFVKDPNQLHVIIESRGLAHAPATVVLERRRDGGPWEEAGRQMITLEENGTVQSVPFDFHEDRPCKLEFRATITDVGPELTTDDNTAIAEVRVIRQKIKVLFIAGSTFPEVEFLRNALLRDRGLAASTWLQAADPQYDHPGNPPIKRLPITQEEMDDYDCIVLYDPDPNAWPPQFPQMLSDFVAKAGGGLVFIAGEKQTKALFDRMDDPATAWVNLLPIVCEPGLYQTEVSMRLSSKEAWKLEITPEGKADPIFQFSQNADENESILNGLPGMYWHFPVTRAKSGATVLARHADPRMRNEHGQHVLLATQLVGPGRTFFVGFDSSYRWRFVDDQLFDGFWARVIDRAGRNKQLGGRYPYTLSTDRTDYRPGSQVTLTARFENLADKDAGLDQLHGELEVADQPPMPLTLTPKKGDNGAFDTTFTVTRPGPHFVRVWAGEGDVKGIARAATLQFPVDLPNLEFDRPTLDLATLQSVARAGGGEVFSLSQADEIPRAFKTLRVARTLEDRHEIWDAPILIGTILAALFGEWVLRKKYRMV
jgi:hypothetical protein